MVSVVRSKIKGRLSALQVMIYCVIGAECVRGGGGAQLISIEE